MDLKELVLVGWIQLAQNRAQWWALVNTIMNLRVPSKVGSFFWLAEILLASQEGFHSMVSVGRSVS